MFICDVNITDWRNTIITLSFISWTVHILMPECIEHGHGFSCVCDVKHAPDVSWQTDSSLIRYNLQTFARFNYVTVLYFQYI